VRALFSSCGYCGLRNGKPGRVVRSSRTDSNISNIPKNEASSFARSREDSGGTRYGNFSPKLRSQGDTGRAVKKIHFFGVARTTKSLRSDPGSSVLLLLSFFFKARVWWKPPFGVTFGLRPTAAVPAPEKVQDREIIIKKKEKRTAKKEVDRENAQLAYARIKSTLFALE